MIIELLKICLVEMIVPRIDESFSIIDEHSVVYCIVTSFRLQLSVWVCMCWFCEIPLAGVMYVLTVLHTSPYY